MVYTVDPDLRRDLPDMSTLPEGTGRLLHLSP